MKSIADGSSVTGRRIIDLQTSLALLHGSSESIPETQDQYGREPFRHPALDCLGRLSSESKAKVLKIQRIAQLAEKYGLDMVVRWKPRRVCSAASVQYGLNAADFTLPRWRIFKAQACLA